MRGTCSTSPRPTRNAQDVNGTSRTGYGEPLVSVRGVCEALNVSRQTVYRLVAEGELPVVKIRDRSLFRLRDVEALVERSTRRTAP